MKSMPSADSISWIVTMCGWFSAEAACASCTKPAAAVVVRRRDRREDLDRDLAVQTRIPRAIDLAHAARADQRERSHTGRAGYLVRAPSAVNVVEHPDVAGGLSHGQRHSDCGRRTAPRGKVVSPNAVSRAVEVGDLERAASHDSSRIIESQCPDVEQRAVSAPHVQQRPIG